MRALILVLVLVCVALAPVAAAAQDPAAQDAAALRKQIDQLQKQLQSVTDRLQRLEAQPARRLRLHPPRHPRPRRRRRPVRHPRRPSSPLRSPGSRRSTFARPRQPFGPTSSAGRASSCSTSASRRLRGQPHPEERGESPGRKASPAWRTGSSRARSSSPCSARSTRTPRRSCASRREKRSALAISPSTCRGVPDASHAAFGTRRESARCAIASAGRTRSTSTTCPGRSPERHAELLRQRGLAGTGDGGDIRPRPALHTSRRSRDLQRRQPDRLRRGHPSSPLVTGGSARSSSWARITRWSSACPSRAARPPSICPARSWAGKALQVPPGRLAPPPDHGDGRSALLDPAVQRGGRPNGDGITETRRGRRTAGAFTWAARCSPAPLAGGSGTTGRSSCRLRVSSRRSSPTSRSGPRSSSGSPGLQAHGAHHANPRRLQPERRQRPHGGRALLPGLVHPRRAPRAPLLGEDDHATAPRDSCHCSRRHRTAACGRLGRRQIRVVTTIPDLKALTTRSAAISSTSSRSREGRKNAHELEIRPRPHAEARRADLLIENGLELDSWAEWPSRAPTMRRSSAARPGASTRRGASRS